MMTRLVFSTVFLTASVTASRKVFRKAHQYFLCVLFLSAAYFLDSCASARAREFALQTEAADTAHTPRPIYVTGKKPISQADPDNLVLDVWKVEDEDYPKEMRVFARVLDSSGNFITKMAPPYGDPDYRKYWTGITEILGGDTVKIKEFTVQEFSDQDPSTAFALALALDHGGSMAGAISYLQEAARMFVGMKFPNDRIAIAKFDSKTNIETPLTADVRDLQKALQNNDLKGYGLYTALYDAMKETSALLAKTQSSTPRAMIVFSDGEDNHSKASDAEVYAFAKQHKIRIFPVGFGYANDTTLSALARSTGGKYYRVYSKRDFARVFKDIYESLRNYYQITYIPTNYNGRREGIITVDPRGRGGLGYGSDSAGRRGRGTIASNTDGNGNRGRGTLGTDIGTNGSGNKTGSGSQGNNGNGNNGNSGDGSGNKTGSGSQGSGGNGNNGNGNNGNGNDGSGNKTGSGSQGNNGNGNGGNSLTTGRFEYDKSVIGLLDTVGTVFSTTKIYFDYKKAEIKPESAPMLDLIAEALQRAPRVKIEVRGHTDNIGGTDFNQRLSELRAEAVVQALVQRGISQKRLQSRGLGLSFPVASNETEEERQKNRRTEFAIIAR